MSINIRPCACPSPDESVIRIYVDASLVRAEERRCSGCGRSYVARVAPRKAGPGGVTRSPWPPPSSPVLDLSTRPAGGLETR